MTFNRTTVAWGVVWSAAILVSTGAMISAFNLQPDPPGHYYGLMSVKPGQRIALHLSNTRTSMVTEGAQQTGPARNLCSAELSLVDSCGTVVARQTGRRAPARMSRQTRIASPRTDCAHNWCSQREAVTACRASKSAIRSWATQPGCAAEAASSIQA